MSKTTKKASFFKLVLIPFFVISLFAQFYANAFLMAFLVDNRPVVELVKKNPNADFFEIMKALKDSSTFIKSVKGSVNVSMDKDGKTKTQVQGEFKTFGLRMILLLLLYLWLRPFFAYARNGDESAREKAFKRYDGFYRGIFSYLFITHVVTFISTSWWYCPPEHMPGAIVFYLLWFVIECYLFYLFLEPTLFMYVSGIFSEPGLLRPSRSSLSIYGKLITMLVFLMLLPLAILAAYIHKEYIIIATYQTTALTLITTSAAFLIGNLQLLYKSVQEPIDFLVEKMQKLASGDFNVQTSVLFDDEIGRLKTNFNMMVGQLKEREEIKDTFGKYVSIEIARHLIENKKVALGGENIVATILFSDIRNFTSMSEKMSPEEVVSMLNRYFSYITEPIMQNHGVINKFIGDAVMAIFTPHLGSENHIQDAIKAALGMRQRLAELNSSGELKYPIQFGIGLNTGALVAGNIGTEKRFEYTVIGDTVNVASRMESLSKDLSHDIILSHSTAESIPTDFLNNVKIERSDPVKIKGKSEAVPVYKLIA